jgi:hypothetical protein
MTVKRFLTLLVCAPFIAFSIPFITLGFFVLLARGAFLAGYDLCGEAAAWAKQRI